MVPKPVAVSTLPTIEPGPEVRANVPPTGLPVKILVSFTQRSAALEVMLTEGGVQTPGAVKTAVEIGLAVRPSKLQRQRVSMDWGGPVCAYAGNAVLQVPPFTRYWRVLPVWQGVPLGAVMLPPSGVQLMEQTLFVIETLAGAAVKTGQVRHTSGAVVAEAVALTQAVVVLRQRAYTVKALEV